MVSNQPSPNRRKGRLLCGAKTRAGAAARSERSRARRVAASTVANRQVRRPRLVVHVSPRPSDSDGSPIEREFERSEMATKPDLKGNYLLAEHASLHRNAITSDDVTRLWQTKRSDSGSDQSGLVGAFVSQTRQKLGLLGGTGISPRRARRAPGSGVATTQNRGPLPSP